MSKGVMARRIALLSSSSLGLAAIVSVASMGVVLAPTVALAQSVTCVAATSPVIGGNGSAAVTLPAGTYNPGLLCNYTGQTATVTTSGSITVSSSGGVPGDPLVNGVNLRATGADDINWTSIAGSVSGGSQSNGPLIDARTASGDIRLTAGALSVNAATGTDGVFAQTGGAGTVTLDLRGAIAATSPTGAGVRVTNGTGLVSIDLSAAASLRGSGTGSSGLVIDSDGAIVVDSDGLIMGGYDPTGPRPAAIVASGLSFTLTLTGDAASTPDTVSAYRASLGGGGYTGDGVPTPTGAISNAASRYTGGHIDLSGVTGGSALNFNSRARWVLTDTSRMSAGDDVVNMDATSVFMTATTNTNIVSDISLGDADQVFIPPGVVDFGGGDDTVNNDGRMLIGLVYTRQGAQGEAANVPPKPDMRFGIRGEIRMLDLEEFNNSGEIWLGIRRFDGTNNFTGSFTGTDRFHDDMLYMPGAAFHGDAGSVVYMDVNLATTQSSCAPSTRDADGYLPAADCIGLQGGGASGTTQLRIFEYSPGDRGSYNPDGTVLVDLAGAAVADIEPDAFVISPDTPRYTDAVGDNGAIEKGVFVFVLGLDADDQQFKLYGIPSSGGQQLPILATAANQLWQTATGGWFQRQVDQRDVDRPDGLGVGTWFNVTGVNAIRDLLATIPIGTGAAQFDNTYDQKDVAISFGWDLISHNTGAASWSLGAMVGYAQSEVTFEDTANTANLEGVHAGAYGGVTFGDFFVDAAFNATWLSLHNDVPTLVLVPGGTLLDTKVQSMGGRIEAGWRWNAGMAWVEPIVGLSTVESSFDDFRIPNDDPDLGRPGVGVSLENADSRRASLGVRVGADGLISKVAPASLNLTLRRVNEFEGRSDVTISNTGPDALTSDTLDGAFNQLTASAGVSSANGMISGYLNVDAVRGDDYESLGVSAGLRVQW